MINLLPASLKQTYRSGRLNRHLAHWIISCLLGMLGAIGITLFGYLYLDKSIESYARQTADTHKQLSAQNLKGIQSEIKDISNNLNLVVDVLSKQVLFSELLTQLTKLLPSGTRLSGLSISQSQGAVDISATATSYAAASQLQTNLSDPANKLFSKADIVSISCPGSTTGFPCNVTIRALFAPDSSYIFSTGTKETN